LHLTRFSMYRQIGAAIQQRLSGRILGISGIANFQPWIDKNADVVNVAFPEVDMQKLPYGDEEFDVVISDQVIAHLPDPRQALAESFRVLKRGGVGIHTTRASGPPSRYPEDYYRFTRDGLLAMCPPGLDVLQLGGWGNRYAMGLMLIHDGFFRFMRIPERPGIRRWLATYNEDDNPIHVWIVARKPK
jgi:SAM-dependent methyltransferase